MLISGVVLLVAGIVILVLNLTWQPEIRDAEFLVAESEWRLKDAPEVIWRFTEIGEGVLTTNSHINDYAFQWAVDDQKLTIRTDWLYDLNDEFAYVLDRGEKTLTLSRGEETVVFVASEAEGE